MTSQPISPTTPTRRPKSLRISGYDASNETYSSPHTNGMSDRTNLSRRSSYSSQNFYQQPSPTTPRPGSSRSFRPMSFQHRRKSSSRYSVGSGTSFRQEDSGLGNLADELEDALDDEYDGQEASFLEGLREGDVEHTNIDPESSFETNGLQTASPGDGMMVEDENMGFSATTQSIVQFSRADRRKSRHQREDSRHQGSNHMQDLDQEDEISSTFSRIVSDIESVTRKSMNTEDTLSEDGGVVARTTNALKDLGNQTNIESNLSRIISAYTSMATHRTYKTRDLFNQAHSLLRYSILELSEETIDILLSDVELLSSTTLLPQQYNPLSSLQILASQTLDLAQTLRSLTDVIQESRISSNAASRKLKNVKDMVEDMRIEQELTETSMMLIHAGDWDRRCRERQAAATCREVIRGFGEAWGLEIDDRSWTHERKQVTIP